MFSSPNSPNKDLQNQISEIIKKASASSPRSKQTNLGPSEVGQSCVRRLSYRLLGWDKVNDSSDPWPAISGTAIHSWLADVFLKDDSNEWLVEHRVEARKGLAGTLDLFDVKAGVVIDHKCVGATSMKTRKAEGPTEEQLIQLSIYGYGLEEQGYEVNKIALAFYPLGGRLDGLHTWIGDYDRAVAEKAMSRIDSTIDLLKMLDVEENPERWSLIPITASRNCTFCPWYVPDSKDLTIGCPGA